MIDSPRAVVLATLDTKRIEADCLLNRLRRNGLACDVVDTSLESGGVVLSGKEKVEAMRKAALKAGLEVQRASGEGALVFVGIGGGTGAQVAAQALSSLPLETPKLLVTTLASDLRKFAAIHGIVLVPTVADLIGTGPAIRNSLSDAASMAAALARGGERERLRDHPTIGITALGVVAPLIDAIVARFARAGHEVTTFHANGFGGAAFARWGRDGLFSGIADCAIHELTRLLGGSGGELMEDRLAVRRPIPRVLLPGGINFFSRGGIETLDSSELNRPHYRHSPDFTHVALETAEMGQAGRLVADSLNESECSNAFILPMRGFSSEDREGGAIENPSGRVAFARELRAILRGNAEIIELPYHINDTRTAEFAATVLLRIMASGNPSNAQKEY
ncbi:MAG: Tm-1-like ATP-binding domain-containing protein [Albidovulum sp.]|nr:Tm-1-like ATP-binding domain-containing protein [Albidovulum sp.]